MSEGLEGRIQVSLTLAGEGPVGVEIRSTRPQVAQGLMAGRTPEGAAELAGLVFSLCGRAQRVAAEAAGAAALGLTPDAAQRQGQTARVLQEIAQEHAWRLLLDWPGQQGQAPDAASLVRLRQAAGDPGRFGAVLADLVETVLLGEPAPAWLGRDLAGLDAWRRAGLTPTARLFGGLGEGSDLGIALAPLLPALMDLTDAQAADLGRRALAEPGYCAQPSWQGGPAETGALARVGAAPLVASWLGQRGRGAGARLLARLVELALLPAGWRTVWRAAGPRWSAPGDWGTIPAWRGSRPPAACCCMRCVWRPAWWPTTGSWPPPSGTSIQRALCAKGSMACGSAPNPSPNGTSRPRPGSSPNPWTPASPFPWI